MGERSTAASKLGLGGHSYIQELGNDPRPSSEEQLALVAACLDAGVMLFDTTYYQERVALGGLLRALGRRDEAEIAAWNFFRQPGEEDELVPHVPYEPRHLDTVLSELQTDRIDVLVVHAHDDAEGLRRELGLVADWMAEGRVRQAALGMAELRHVRSLPDGHPIGHVFAPYNAFNRAALPVFEEAKRRGMATVAMSPFVRGWKLDEIGGDAASVADVLLRWVAFQDAVDRVVVAMRRAEWVRANLRSLERGPLTAEERARLAGWVERAR
jgi:aryl-alcohol dehydrogenase-like predicted oxidoreductase